MKLSSGIRSAVLFTFALILMLVGCATPPGPAGSPAPSTRQSGSAAMPPPPVNQFPRPVPAPDARRIDAEASAAFSGSHSQMPPIPLVQRDPGGKVAEIEIMNDTPHALIVRYSGVTSQSMQLPSKQKGTVRIEIGDYLIAASTVQLTGVRPFAGRQRFEGGRYSTTWVIRTSSSP